MRRIIGPTVLANGGDLSANYESNPFEITQTDNVGLHIIWNGTPTGEFKILASIDGKSWDALNVSPSIGAAAGPGSTLVNLNNVPYAFIKIAYERASGTGTVTIHAMAKQGG